MGENETFSFKKRKEGDTWNYVLRGRLNTATTPILERELTNTVLQEEKLVLDFHGVEYVSSAGLRLLLSMHKKMKEEQGMRLQGVNQEVEEVLEMTGFIHFLNIEVSE
ncbi:MAG: STAS domain-containing protein [Lachnospiraceae bacterium]|nr:STAS domain-containing protein [Lachnospiraceae bacterium]